MKRDRRLVVSSLVAALAVFASVLVVFPAAVAQTSTTPPPLAWGSNDHAQLAVCLDPYVADPANHPGELACPSPNKVPSQAQPVEVSDLGDATQVSAGLHHSLAVVQPDNPGQPTTVWAWGRNMENELADGHSVYTDKGGGYTTDPAKTSSVPDPAPDRPAPGQVYQREETLTQPSTAPGPGTYFERTHYIGEPEALTDVMAVAAGGYHSLALKNDGTVWAWGDNFCGQLGNGKTFTSSEAHLSPPAAVKVLGLENTKVVAVAAGRGHSLALDENGVLWAWGDNRWGQLGNEATRPPTVNNASSYYEQLCRMPDGGPGGLGQILPTSVPLPRVVSIAAGSDHSLALTEDGKVWSWGNNCSGQLGSSTDAATASRSVPGPVLGLPGDPISGVAPDPVKALAAGGDAVGGHSLALTDSGKVWAWGLADVLGTGSGSTAGPLPAPCDNRAFTTSNPDVAARAVQQARPTPAPVLSSATGQPLSDVVAVDAGVFHALAVQTDGEVFAWGRNDVGQLGPLTPLTPVTPLGTATPAIKALDGTVTAVSAGSHSLTLPGGSNPATTTNTGSTTTTTQPTTTTTTQPTTTTTTQPTTTTTTQPTTTTTTTPPPAPSQNRIIHWQQAADPPVDPADGGDYVPPAARHASAMAYDAARGRTILFGGLNHVGGYATYGDTWAWDGLTMGWSKVETSATAPQARHGHAMAYDAARKNVVLFGGFDSHLLALGDTWTWTSPDNGPLHDTYEGGTWTRTAPTSGQPSPPPRAFPSMTYDSERSRVLLFGGEAADGTPLGDTWAWDGSKWTNVTPMPAPAGEAATSPPARSRSAMAYFPSTEPPTPGYALLHGGWDGSQALDDTWSWNGSTWGQKSTGPYPERRQGHVMAYHPATEQIVVTGGSSDVALPTSCCARTWTWDGRGWGYALSELPVQLADAPLLSGGTDLELAGQRSSPAMAEDRAGHLALFGGRNFKSNHGGDDLILADTVLYVVPAAVVLPNPPPTQPPEVCATRESITPWAEPSSTPASTTTTTWAPTTTTTTTPAASTTTTTQPSGTTVEGPAWEHERPELVNPPSAREGAAVAYDPVKQETILFGGFSRTGEPSCVLDDTWMWNGSAWTNVTPARAPAGQPPTSPQARYGHTMAYDAAGNIVLFGGSDGGNDLADTWVWKDRTWARVETGAAPSPRARQTMSSGVHKQGGPRQVVLFGGDHQGRALGDTWVWDGFAWDKRSPDTSPPPRGYAQMAFDAAPDRRNTVLAGGWDSTRTSGATLSDTWLWNGSNWSNVTPRNAGGVNSGVMAFDRSSQRVLLLEGTYPADGRTGDPGEGPGTYNRSTYAWNGTSWAPVDHAGSATSPASVPPTRTFGVMAEDKSGVVFFGGYGRRSGEGTPVDPNTNADQADTWTYAGTPVTVPVDPPDPEVPGPPAEYGIEIRLSPSEIDADGGQKAIATAKATNYGQPDPGRKVSFKTNGDVTFSCPSGSTCPSGSVVADHGDGTYSTTITASRTPGTETITALNEGNGSSSAQLVERGITITLDPSSIRPGSKSRATATLTPGTLPDQDVQFRTNGDATFSAVEHLSQNVWAVTITASDKEGPQTITAAASPSGLSASAILTVGGDGWFDTSPPASAPAPPARDQSAMAFDALRNRTVTFGGFAGDRNNPFGDTWVWNGSAWSNVTPPPAPAGQPATSPPARYGHAMAYDVQRDRVVLYGGYGRFGYLGDTWTWDGTKWTEHTWHPDDAAASPSPRYRPAMAYDAEGDRVVLFGGWTSNDCNFDADSCPALGDTWTWDGARWTERLTTTPPPPLPNPTVTEITNPTPIVMPLPLPPPGCPPEKCEAETPTDGSIPGKSMYPSKILIKDMPDKVSKVTVRLNRLSWTQAGPADADIMLVAPDGKRSVMVMSDACGNAAIPREPEKEITLTFDDAALSALSTDPCRTDVYRPTNLVAPYEATDFHSPDAFPAPAPRRADSDSLSHFNGIEPNGEWSLYVVDDAPHTPNPAGEAGRIDGGWTLSVTTSKEAVTAPAPPVTPPARGWAAMAYHGPSQKIVLYGGSPEVFLEYQSQSSVMLRSVRPFKPLADTWTWDGANWEQEGAGTNPGLRHSASMAFHPGSDQLVLYGGSDTGGGELPDRALADPNGHRRDTSLDDTWTWDGKAWARDTSPDAPPSRHSAAMAQGPSGTIVMFSGFHVITPSGNSVFTYMGDTWVYERKMTVRLDHGVLPADEKSATRAVATVVDAAGAGIRGLTVTFRTDGDAKLSSTTDHGDGTYSATVTASATDEIETITAATPFGSAAASLNEVRAVPCSKNLNIEAGKAGTWDTVAPMPHPRLAVAVASGGDGRIYTFGGDPSGGRPMVESYDPCTNNWQTLPVMPGGGRAWATASMTPDGRIYVIGGSYQEKANHTARSVEVYTPGVGSTPGRWKTLPPMPDNWARSASAVADDGRLYVMGGAIEGRTVAVYTPGPGGGPGRWQAAPDLPFARFALAAATAPDGRILAIGGGDPSRGGGYNTVEAYVPGSDNWQPGAPMTHPRVYSAAAVGDGLVYALGGAPAHAILAYEKNPPTDTVEAYSICTETWLPVAPMPRTRDLHGAARGGDGRIYVMGGVTEKPEDDGLNESPSASLSWLERQANQKSTDAVDAYTPDPSAGPCPKVSINNVTVTEPPQQPPSLTAPAQFTVSLDRPALQPVRVDWETTSEGTATPDSDYAVTRGRVQFGPGETSQTVDAPPATVPSSSSPGTTLPGGLSALPVVDPSAPPTTVPDPSQTPISKTIDVPVLADDITEDPEKFTVRLNLLTPATATVADDRGEGTINDRTAGFTPPPPVVSVDNAPEVTEPASGTTPARFPVTLSSPSASEVRVNYRTEPRTGPDAATAGDDYTAVAVTTGQVVFTPGQSRTQYAPVDIRADQTAEGPETFSLVLAAPVGATLDPNKTQAIGTILDRGGDSVVPPKVSVDNAPDVTEPGPTAAGVSAVFPIRLSSPAREPVTVHYATEDGSAKAGADYTATPGSVTIPAGAPGAEVLVPVLANPTPNRDVRFFLNITGASGADPDDTQGEAVIHDPGYPVASVSGPPAKVTEPATGATATAVFGVTLVPDATQLVRVPYITVDNSAKIGDDGDYTFKSGVLEFAPGDSFKTVDVAVRGDATPDEAEETFFLDLGAPTGATLGQNRRATATIVEGQFTLTPTVKVTGPAPTPEPKAGNAPSRAVFDVSLSGDTDHDVTVRYSTADGSAESAKGDYTATSKTVTIPAGSTNAQVPVDVLGDTISPEQPDETFTVALSEHVGAEPEGGPATAVIVDNPPQLGPYAYACDAASDPTPTGATLSAHSTDPTVSSAAFTVRRGGAEVATRVDDGAPFSTTVGGLAPDTEYTFAVVFNPGDHAQTGDACRFGTLAAQSSTTSTSTTSTTLPTSTSTTSTTALLTTTTTPALPTTTTTLATTPQTFQSPDPAPLPPGGDTPLTPPPATPPPAPTPPPAAPTPPVQAPQGMAQAQPGAQAQSQSAAQSQVQTAAQTQAAAQAQSQAAAQAQAGAQGQGQSQGQSQQQGQRQQEAQAQPGGAMGDQEKEAEVQVETEGSDGEKGTTYLSSSVRKEAIPAPALAWATTAVVAAALGMAVGLRRRAGAGASVVMSRPDRSRPGQRSRKAQRRRR